MFLYFVLVWFFIAVFGSLAVGLWSIKWWLLGGMISIWLLHLVAQLIIAFPVFFGIVIGIAFFLALGKLLSNAADA